VEMLFFLGIYNMLSFFANPLCKLFLVLLSSQTNYQIELQGNMCTPTADAISSLVVCFPEGIVMNYFKRNPLEACFRRPKCNLTKSRYDSHYRTGRKAHSCT